VSRLKLNYGGVRYLDRTRALEIGEISPAGIDLNYIVPASIGDLFRAVAARAEFDVAEFSLCTLMLMIGKGDNRLVGLPIFPSRAFRHEQIYINVKSGIKQPSDLAGRLVGVTEYQMTAALWVRAHLQHDYGVPPEKIRWRTGGFHVPRQSTRMHIELPPGVELQHVPEGDTLQGMLLDGRIDALVSTEPPKAFVAGDPAVARLFPDVRRVELEYFKRTGFFPIMHAVVIRRDVYEANRWIAMSLLNAFNEAKRIGREQLAYQGAYAVSLPWLSLETEELNALFGGDAFPYGFQSNLRILEAMTTYAHEQGLTLRKLDPHDLFAPEALVDSIPG
jgi:4,5-dihydroxyphthalate decarboxylase